MDDNNKKILALGAAATLGTILLGYLFYRSRDRHTSRQSDQNNTKKSEEIPEKEAIPQLKKKVDDEDEERFVKATKLKEEGNAAFKAQQFDKAIQLYTEAIALSNKDVHLIYSNRSAAHLANQNYAMAVADANKTIEISPNWSKGYFRLGKALFQVKDPSGAYMALYRGLKEDPNSEEIKGVLSKVRSELPLQSDRDSRHIVERNIMKLYFERLTQDLCQTSNVDYKDLLEKIKKTRETSKDYEGLESLVPEGIIGLRILSQILSTEYEDYEGAEVFSKKALAIQPDVPEILTHLVYVILNKRDSNNLDDLQQALAKIRQAFKKNNTDILTATLLATTIVRIHLRLELTEAFPFPIHEILSELDQCYRVPGITKIIVADSGMQTWIKLFQDPEITQKLQAEEMENMQKGVSPTEAYVKGLIKGTFNKICLNSFFISSLSEVTFTNAGLERVLCPFRYSLATLKPGAEFKFLRNLIYALGLQAWRNGYAWALTGSEEENNLVVIRKKLVNMLSSSSSSSSQNDRLIEDVNEPTGTLVTDGQLNDKLLHYIALVAMYEPLWKIDNLYSVVSQVNLTKLEPLLAKLFKMTIFDHYTELEIKKTIPSLTSIPESPLVKFYNNNVFPIWDNLPLLMAKITPHLEAEWIFPNYKSDHPPNTPIKLLIVGCGTGNEPLQMATVYENVQITALDFSASQLAYAIRMTREFGMEDTIKYYLADIMTLKPNMLPTQDVIVAHGVLQHLPDLFKGWERLVPLLRPGGLMKVTLYPKRWIDQIARARKFLISKISPPLFEERTSSPLPNVIRQPSFEELRLARAFILDSHEEFEDILSVPFIYSLNEFLDLLFNPQIWGITFKLIGQCLSKLQLNLVGFEFPGISHETILNYRIQFPDDPYITNFDYLDKFEEENPSVFRGYLPQIVFTCEKPKKS